jgi:hypothetical protein
MSVYFSPLTPSQEPVVGGFTARVAQAVGRARYADLHLIPDISGDRVPEIVVADPFWPHTASRQEGIAWVIFGRTDGAFVETRETAGWGYEISGAGTRAFLADRVAGGRDVNGDGIGDLVISAAGNDEERRARSAYVVFGKVTPEDIDLSIPGPWGYRIRGTTGSHVALSGDMNGDDRAEVVVSIGRHRRYALAVLPGGEAPGGPVWRSRMLAVTVDTALSAREPAAYVTDSGDLNADGRADLVLVDPYFGSSPTATPSRFSPLAHTSLLVPAPHPGAVFVVFGPAGTQAVRLSSMSPDEGFMVRGADAPDRLDSARVAGDFTGDGLQDLVINAPNARRDCRGGSGTYLVPSRPAQGPLRLGNAGSRALRIDSGRKEERLVQLPVGDVDFDGRDDLLLYAEQLGRGRGARYPRAVSARLYGIFGRSSLPTPDDHTPPRAKLVLERNRGQTFRTLLRRGFIRATVTLSEPARVRVAIGVSTDRRDHPRFVKTTRRLKAGTTRDIRVFLDRSARRELRRAAAETRRAWRKQLETLESRRHDAAHPGFVYGPSLLPEAVLYASADLHDERGNACSASSGLFGSVPLIPASAERIP